MASILTWIKRWLGGGSPDQPSGHAAGQNGQRHDTDSEEQRETPTTTQVSCAEREAFWQDIPHETRMHEWEQQMSVWIAGLQADPATWDAYAFLQRLLGGDKNGQAQTSTLPAGQP